MKDVPWTKLPLVGVSMNPIKGPHIDYYSFCDLAVLIRRPDGTIETVVDCRTRCLPPDGHTLGNFTAEETLKYNLVGFDYAQAAKDVGPLLTSIAWASKGCVPLAIHSQVCRALLHRAVRMEEGRGTTFDKKDAFVLREKSRWIDLGLWRLNSGAERFSGALSPRERLLDAFDRMPALAKDLRIAPHWTLPELLDFQGQMIPF